MKKSLFTIGVFVKVSVRRYFRDKTALFFTIAFPLIFVFVFGGIFGKNNNISFNIALINESQSQFSKQFVDQMTSSKIFKVKPNITSLDTAKQKMSRSEIDAAIVLPR